MSLNVSKCALCDITYVGGEYGLHQCLVAQSLSPVKPRLKTNKESKVSKQTHIVEELNETGEVVQYHCTACRKSFRSRTQKYYHLQCNHLNEKTFECDICKKSFARHSQLKYHRESHTSPINQCTMCQKTFSNPLALKKHESLHKVEPKPCPHCDKTFLKKTSLEQHIAAQHLHQLQYGCAYCNKRYASKSTLQLHLQSHEKKRFECSVCGKLFQRNSILNLHLKRHSETTPSYKCQVCDKAFGESGALSRHRKIHEENSLQYHCLLCDKNILRKDNMSRHMHTIHPDEKYEEVVQIIIKPSPLNSIEQHPKIIEKTEITSSVEYNNNLLIGNDNPGDNFVILENKLLQKPLLTRDIEEMQLDKVMSATDNYWKQEGESLVLNQIQVITALPSNGSETGTEDINATEVPFKNSPEDENFEIYNNTSTVQSSGEWTCIQQQHHPSESQVVVNSTSSILNNQEHRQQYVVCHTNNLGKAEQIVPLANEFENTQFPIFRNTSSVIRSIGNVNKNLTSTIINEEPCGKAQNIALDYEYKHKKYNHHYNVDLYRKILGCDDDSCQYEEQRDQVQQENISEATNTTAVHWRKSFKNIYETSAS